MKIHRVLSLNACFRLILCTADVNPLHVTRNARAIINLAQVVLTVNAFVELCISYSVAATVPTSANPMALHNSSSSVHRTLLCLLCGGCLFCTTESQDPVSTTVALTPVKL